MANSRSEPQEVAISEFHLEVRDEIKRMTERLGGISPTLAEVGARFDLSRQRVHQIFQILQAHGHIEYERYKHRSVRVVEGKAA